MFILKSLDQTLFYLANQHNLNMKFFRFLSLFGLLLFPCFSSAQSKTNLPKLNQEGFFPNTPKIAITPEINATSFVIKDKSDGTVKYQGNLVDGETNTASEENVKIADFSDFGDAGFYVLEIEGGQTSYPFAIGDNVLTPVTNGLLKAYYFMRASTALDTEYAGIWARAAGHADTAVYVHASAATNNRPEGTLISAPKGWYDAGDYNKYVVNSGISTYTLLLAYEQFPAFFEVQNLNIPESSNNIPDILDEALWNLHWLLNMQDPNDGGVYHKLTTAKFTGMVMPSATNNIQRYVVQKSSPATYDFAAIMAQAYRVYKPFLPEFADSCLSAAKEAWQWGISHEETYYRQKEMNDAYEPNVETGEYGDGNDSDEKFWARTELYIATGKDVYYNKDGWMNSNIENPSWGDVRALGLYSLVHHRKNLTSAAIGDTSAMKQKLIDTFSWYVNDAKSAAYRSPFGMYDWQFYWGSNGAAGNLGMGILQAFLITQDSTYYKSAIQVADYLLGRNPVGYSYVTGFGDKTPMHIHHRPSEADGITEPVPGLVAGGANPGNQNDDCGSSAYNSDLPAVSYLDHVCSYSTNEITINWNAPFVYVFSALAALTSQTGKTVSNETDQGNLIPSKFQLKQNYPNPFNPSTNIEFELDKAGYTSLSVYDVNGKLIQDLINGNKQAGDYSIRFSAEHLSSGIYFYRLKAPDYIQSRKMVLIK